VPVLADCALPVPQCTHILLTESYIGCGATFTLSSFTLLLPPPLPHTLRLHLLKHSPLSSLPPPCRLLCATWCMARLVSLTPTA